MQTFEMHYLSSLFFSSEVVGTDGARQQLRHEQNGAMLMLLGMLKGISFGKKEVFAIFRQCHQSHTRAIIYFNRH